MKIGVNKKGEKMWYPSLFSRLVMRFGGWLGVKQAHMALFAYKHNSMFVFHIAKSFDLIRKPFDLYESWVYRQVEKALK